MTGVWLWVFGGVSRLVVNDTLNDVSFGYVGMLFGVLYFSIELLH